ncbi:MULTISPECIES: TIGR04283 family arsenosugar biosynthesis glycosyltransferase [Rhodomicrobium]|uniref:TIGR04283 family arsenosugar biosynthesis glycosyltransferase n=1 Tax=Rhodomicrobium TaxID=1068 RepID=UPI000B4B27CF|nr:MULTISPECIES: TIGR04283 family arsenosugar biosynthesis glycosyltransferase [Rhodomicrobium]
MISVVIPTLNADAHLARTLTALVPAAVHGIVRDVVVADGGSTDRTPNVAEAAGARFVLAQRGRGQQLAAGAGAAKSDWLLFLHADTVLQEGWEEEALEMIRGIELRGQPQTAAVFRFGLDDRGLWASYLKLMVGLRCLVFRMPYGDQGLLISRRLYDEVGGFRPMALMEDVDMIARLGRGRLRFLRAIAVTSARRYRAEGYFRRTLRNLTCLSLYYMRVPPHVLARLYG